MDGNKQVQRSVPEREREKRRIGGVDSWKEANKD
jgi:hypothetical protein